MPANDHCESNSTNDDTFSETLQKSIDNIIKEEGYVTSNVYKRMVSTDGANYMAQLFEVDVKGTTDEGEKETNIFVKRSLNGENFDSFIAPRDAYASEVFFYNELSKIFTQLQEEADVPQEERFKTIKSYNGSNMEAMFFENVARQGFKLPERMDVVSLKYAELSIQELAKFHGLSFVLKRKRPEYFAKKLKSMNIPFVWNNGAWLNSFTGIINIGKDNVDDAELKERIEKFLPKIKEKYPKYTTGDSTVTCCLCHGDYRHSNILMKEIDGEIAEVLPIDYQTLHYGCPVTDLLYLIFIGTDGQFRKDHMADLKDLYHGTLGRFLQYFDLDVNDIYPRKEFDNDFQERLDYGLMVCILFYPVLFVAAADAPDLVKDDLSNLSFKPNIKFQGRFRELLSDYIEWGYL